MAAVNAVERPDGNDRRLHVGREAGIVQPTVIGSGIGKHHAWLPHVVDTFRNGDETPASIDQRGLFPKPASSSTRRAPARPCLTSSDVLGRERDGIEMRDSIDRRPR